MRKIGSAAGLTLLALALVGTASAGKVGFLKTWVYDPNDSHAASAAWTKEGLVLDNQAPTGVAAAGATVKGLEGETLTALSFEFKNGTYTGAGAPRFSASFENAPNSYRFFSALYGEQSEGSEPGWTKVTFSDTTPYCDGATAVPVGCFGSAPLASIFLVQDEGPATAVLRNITVNDVTVDKFANS